MSKKYTFEYVYNYFKEQKCELLEKEYINNRIPMRYKCKCGNISKICFSSFKNGNRCAKCAGTEKLTYKYVQQYFKRQGCELLEKEYINTSTKMSYKCSCGNTSIISFDKFKIGRRCNKCSERRRYTFQEVYNYFEEQGCKLLETNFIDVISKLKYKCSCGDITKISFSNFQNGRRCKKCGIKRSSSQRKHTFGYVYNYFKKQKCELLEKEYKNVLTKMNYKCKCGNVSQISFSNFKKGNRCDVCSKQKRKKTMLLRYGVPFFVSCKFSKESQKLFKTIYYHLENQYQNKTYFADLNQEFAIQHKNKCFKYDFVNSKLKKAIEYNGSVFHPQPHQKNNEIGWFAFDKNKTVQEAREYEKIKYEGLEKKGYKILTVWDYELRKDFDSLVKKCMDFLLI